MTKKRQKGLIWVTYKKHTKYNLTYNLVTQNEMDVFFTNEI